MRAEEIRAAVQGFVLGFLVSIVCCYVAQVVGEAMVK